MGNRISNNDGERYHASKCTRKALVGKVKESAVLLTRPIEPPNAQDQFIATS